VLATAFSGLIAAGIFAGLSDVQGLHGWQWLFILEGAGSVVAAIVAFVVLVDFPESKSGSGMWLFTADERELAQQRIRLDRVSLPSADRSVWHGLGLAVKDVRTWIFVRTFHYRFHSPHCAERSFLTFVRYRSSSSAQITQPTALTTSSRRTYSL